MNPNIRLGIQICPTKSNLSLRSSLNVRDQVSQPYKHNPITVLETNVRTVLFEGHLQVVAYDKCTLLRTTPLQKLRDPQ